MSVTASELALIQADLAEQVCDKTCEIWRAPNATDEWGSPAKGNYVLNSTTKCGMAQPRADLLANYDYLIGSLAASQVHLPYSTNVQVTDHLIIEGQTWHVHVLLDPHSVPGLLPVLVAKIK